ncbi:DUF1353 domain-containing protein [Granulicella paludicola]|uniref:DUF1353 domain-containing protein n=1 Tax=Granulicella paludicola TaxID=474951 RepID=UPI0021DFBFFA|nr:DUF1353 domain-containing protein [Granulicella paludicola]
MKLLEPFGYKSPTEQSLTAQAGFTTDGASIPRALWTAVGSPFTGKYLPAAVIHDVGCKTHQYTWQDTDRMFYDAMLDAGESEHHAKLLYWGVVFGGPHWVSGIAQGNTVAELNRKVASVGGQPVGLPMQLAGPLALKFAIPLPPKTVLQKADVKKFDKFLRSREKEGRPVDLREIDALAPPDPELVPQSIRSPEVAPLLPSKH